MYLTTITSLLSVATVLNGTCIFFIKEDSVKDNYAQNLMHNVRISP